MKLALTERVAEQVLESSKAQVWVVASWSSALDLEVVADDVAGAVAVELADAIPATVDFACSVDLDAGRKDPDALDSSVDIVRSCTFLAAAEAQVVRTLCERVAHDFGETRQRQENSIGGYGT